MESSIVGALALVRLSLRFFSYSAHVPSFHISYYFTIILLSDSSSYFTLTVLVREVSCVGSCMGSPFPIVHAKWSLVFRSLASSSQRLKTPLSLVYNNNTVLLYIIIDVGLAQFLGSTVALNITENDSFKCSIVHYYFYYAVPYFILNNIYDYNIELYFINTIII